MNYYRPETIDEALRLLNEMGPEAKVLAGGQDVLPLMNQGKLAPMNIVDLKRLKSLSGISTDNGRIVIGALTTHRSIEKSAAVQTGCGLLAEAASQIGGGLQVRNRGTIGGALCSGNPVYDFAPCLRALDAELRLLSIDGERRLDCSDFFQEAHKTALRPNELLMEVIVPVSGRNAGFSYKKLKFSDGCYSIASAACVLELSSGGSCDRIRLALGGVSAIPQRVGKLEAELAGSGLSDSALSLATKAAEQAVSDPITDVHADGEYRRAMAGVMARRALAAAFERARGLPQAF
jgi:carbon-monoxide dehydrogenase medium subunit/2-furoyl-CoA dehydrogenase FAD binding subunit